MSSTCAAQLLSAWLPPSPSPVFHDVNFWWAPCPIEQGAVAPSVPVVEKNSMGLEGMDFELNRCVQIQIYH